MGKMTEDEAANRIRQLERSLQAAWESHTILERKVTNNDRVQKKAMERLEAELRAIKEGEV